MRKAVKQEFSGFSSTATHHLLQQTVREPERKFHGDVTKHEGPCAVSVRCGKSKRRSVPGLHLGDQQRFYMTQPAPILTFTTQFCFHALLLRVIYQMNMLAWHILKYLTTAAGIRHGWRHRDFLAVAHQMKSMQDVSLKMRSKGMSDCADPSLRI